MSNDKSTINIPPMPKPAEFKYDPSIDSAFDLHNRAAQQAYEQALKAWQEAVAAIAGSAK
jgi:hypothetical protein